MALVQIQYEDQVTPFLDWAINNKPKWFTSSLKSTGYWAKQKIDSGIRSNAPGGQPYPVGMSSAKRRDIDDGMMSHNPRRKPKSRYLKLGGLRKAVKYDKTQAGDGIVTVGWASRSAVRLGTFQEKGVFQPVTEKMRRMFFAAGIGLSKGHNTIAIPVSATYAPMQPIIERGAPTFMLGKILSYLNGNESRSFASSRRVYRVYGGGFTL